MSNSLSLCMIVKNEERNLQECLDSVRDIADEMIVVDTGSHDATPQLAAHNGAIVVGIDFRYVDFATARNQALKRASCNWILMLDADEVLDRTSLPLIKDALANGDNAGYYLARRNYNAAHLETTDYAVRLFPNRPEYRYRGRVHETIDAAILEAGGRLRVSGAFIDHKFATSPEIRRRKNHWYIAILKEELAANPADDSRLDFLAAEYHQLGLFSEATCVAECIARVRPLDPHAHLNAGVYHLMFQPDFLQARADFTRALELRPGYPQALSFLNILDDRENKSAKDSALNSGSRC